MTVSCLFNWLGGGGGGVRGGLVSYANGTVFYSFIFIWRAYSVLATPLLMSPILYF
jgi:hypothetical protein